LACRAAHSRPTWGRRLEELAAAAQRVAADAIEARTSATGAALHGDLVLHDRCQRVQEVIREALVEAVATS
jgi:hypothetical protein